MSGRKQKREWFTVNVPVSARDDLDEMVAQHQPATMSTILGAAIKHFKQLTPQERVGAIASTFLNGDSTPDSTDPTEERRSRSGAGRRSQ